LPKPIVSSAEASRL